MRIRVHEIETQFSYDLDCVVCSLAHVSHSSVSSVPPVYAVRPGARSQVPGDRHEKLTMRAAHLAQPGTRDTTIRLRFVCTSYHRLRTCFFKKKVASIPQGHMARHALMAHCSKVSTTLTLHMITRTSREVRTRDAQHAKEPVQSPLLLLPLVVARASIIRASSAVSW